MFRKLFTLMTVLPLIAPVSDLQAKGTWGKALSLGQSLERRLGY